MTFHRRAVLAAYFMLSLLVVVFVPGPVLLAKPGDAVTPSFAGRFVDHQNPTIQMSVRKDAGLWRVVGGDEAYGYTLSCLVKKLNAVCTGHGGRLEGENFLYQSTFQINPNGTMVERWKAFNNLQTVTGQTRWKRR